MREEVGRGVEGKCRGKIESGRGKEEGKSGRTGRRGRTEIYDVNLLVIYII